jgi:hypothetical protein
VAETTVEVVEVTEEVLAVVATTRLTVDLVVEQRAEEVNGTVLVDRLRPEAETMVVHRTVMAAVHHRQFLLMPAAVVTEDTVVVRLQPHMEVTVSQVISRTALIDRQFLRCSPT